MLRYFNLFKQNHQGSSAKDVKKQAEPNQALPIKGKPRLLLMGQRRYVLAQEGLTEVHVY